ncbi:hypothetical protein ACFVZ3_14460 [Kitasatospora purpeofusca]|uniref:hypothetical protein n=1 Tax=Kitasatospora purpeofusca TaxID=67352 RepID=UPI0036883AC0
MNATQGPRGEHVDSFGHVPGHRSAVAGHPGDGPPVLTADAAVPGTTAGRVAEIITLATEFASLGPVRIKNPARRVMSNHTVCAPVQIIPDATDSGPGRTARSGTGPGPCRG